MPESPDALAQLRQLYRDVFDSPKGRLVLDDLRAAYGDRQSYVDGDVNRTAFNEGQRSVYRRIATMLRPEPKEKV